MGAHPPWTDDREHDVALVQSFVDVLPEIDTGWDIVGRGRLPAWLVRI